MRIPSDTYETIIQASANVVYGLDPADVAALKAARGVMSVGAYTRTIDGNEFKCPVLTATDFDPTTEDPHPHPLHDFALNFDERMRRLYDGDFYVFEVA